MGGGARGQFPDTQCPGFPSPVSPEYQVMPEGRVNSPKKTPGAIKIREIYKIRNDMEFFEDFPSLNSRREKALE